MRFEDPKSEPLAGETGPDGLPTEATHEREAVEKAFWDACTLELVSSPPVYERTLQLVQEVRDTLCSLMPPHWDDQLLLASDHAEHMRSGIVAARAMNAAAAPPTATPQIEGGLADSLVISYMRAVSEQVRALCTASRVGDLDRWLESTLYVLAPGDAPEGGAPAAAPAAVPPAGGEVAAAGSASGSAGSSAGGEGGSSSAETTPSATAATSSSAAAASAANASTTTTTTTTTTAASIITTTTTTTTTATTAREHPRLCDQRLH